MKASEVLRRYQTGERNFQRVSLRGQSFKNQDLSGADFSEADIRSTNFTSANLRGAKFCVAKFGLQRRWATFLVILSWLLAGILGLFSIFAIYVVSLIFSNFNNEVFWFFLIASLIVLVAFLILIIRQGIRALGIRALARARERALARVRSVTAAVVLSIAVAVASPIVLLAVLPAAVEVAVAVTAAVVVAVTAAVVVAVTAAVVGARKVAVTLLIASPVAAALLIALPSSAVGTYIGWRAMKGDKRYPWIRSFAIALAARKGTSFCSADLTDANFTGAILKSTDFRKATIPRTRWYKAKMLDYVRPGDTYLKDSQVRQWLIGEGTDKNFDRKPLRGINLQGANLADASFICTDLREANLQDADLSRAKLVQTQLDRTDLTGATLTGAFIENWGITSSTMLNGVRCEYVFMRLPLEKRPGWLALPAKESLDSNPRRMLDDDYLSPNNPFLPLPVEESLDSNPRRKPDNWAEVFEDDDFADFIRGMIGSRTIENKLDSSPQTEASGEDINANDTGFLSLGDISDQAANTTNQSSKILVRYPNLDCPNSSLINQRFSLYVQLLIKPHKNEVQAIEIEDTNTSEELLEVEIVLRAHNFEIEDSNIRVVQVKRDEDTEERFVLVPLQLGEQQIRVDFYQNGRRINTVRRNILIIE